MKIIMLYILIGFIYGLNNYRIMLSHEKERHFPNWYHAIAGLV